MRAHARLCAAARLGAITLGACLTNSLSVAVIIPLANISWRAFATWNIARALLADAHPIAIVTPARAAPVVARAPRRTIRARIWDADLGLANQAISTCASITRTSLDAWLARDAKVARRVTLISSLAGAIVATDAIEIASITHYAHIRDALARGAHPLK